MFTISLINTIDYESMVYSEDSLFNHFLMLKQRRLHRSEVPEKDETRFSSLGNPVAIGVSDEK